MGTIQRESLGTFIIEFVGLVIGFISILFIYPLSDEAFGYAQFILSSSLLLVPFMGLGISNAVIKYYPETFEREGKKNNLILFTLALTAITSLSLVILVEIFSSVIVPVLYKLDFNVILLSENKLAILALGYVLVLVNTLIAFYSNHGKIATPHLIKELGIKIFLPLFVLAFYYSIIDLMVISKLLILFYLLVLLVLIIYGLSRRMFYVDFRKSLLPYFKIKGLFPYMTFSSLTSIGAIMAFRIDLVMIAPLLTVSENGVYAKILVIAAVIEIPLRVFTRTAGPTIAKYWHEKDTTRIQDIYQSSSNNSLLLACLLLLLLVFNLEQIFLISSNPESFNLGYQIFLILVIGKIIGVVSGLSNTIISFSPSYKYNLYFLLCLALMNIVLNYYLITEIGLLGAAWASAISIVIFHITKLLFLYFKYNIHPFTSNMFKTILITIGISIAIVVSPSLDNIYLNILLRSVLIMSIFVPLILVLNVSEDINRAALLYSSKIKSRFFK